MILQYTQILNSKKRFIHSKGMTCYRVFFEWKDGSLLQPSDCIYMSSEFSLLFPEVWGLEASGEVAETLVNCCLVAKSCLTLCDPMDCSLPGSSVHGILQATLEWVAIPFSKGLFLTQGSNLHLLHGQADSLPLSHLGSLLCSLRH